MATYRATHTVTVPAAALADYIPENTKVSLVTVEGGNLEVTVAEETR